MLIKTEDLAREDLEALGEPLVHQIYCGLDTCVTLEVFEELSKLLAGESGEPEYPLHYQFERALQAPALDMMLRGFLIDGYEREVGKERLSAEMTILCGQLNDLAREVWGKELNPSSPKQLKEFFFQRMRLPEIWLSQKGQKKLSTNREALEKLELYLHARPFVALITEYRDRKALYNQLNNEIDPDGRFRMSINIGGTETGRFSTSKSVTGTGGNGQNLKRDDDLLPGEVSIRRCFIADRGFKLGNIDLEQTESRDVGFLQGDLLGDWRYLNSCEAGDLHTTVAKLVWPGLGWTGDAREDRKIADQPFYRHFSYRDMAKRGGHLTNYMGTAWTAARSLKVPLGIMEEFQENYTGRAFPAFNSWWRWVAQEIQLSGVLTTPYGRRRQFFGRSDDDATLREAIAYVPQSMTADRMNLGLWRVWKYMPEVQLLAQVHDSICFQFPERLDEKEIIQKALALVESPLTTSSGRVVTVKGEAKVGWNWGAFGPANPDGLVKWSPQRPDRRQRQADGLRRIF